MLTTFVRGPRIRILALALPVAFVYCTTIGVASMPIDESGTPQKIAASALKQDMRKVWSDHVIWTRDYLIAVAADAPPSPPTTASRRATS